MSFSLPPLYVLLDSGQMPAAPDARAAWLRLTVEELAAAGVTLLQLREKSQPDSTVLRDAQTICETAGGRMTLLLNDRVELLARSGFHGVHLGQGDMPVAEARALLGPDAILGVSTHNPGQVREADATSAHYIACGPVFATATKADAEPVIGLAGVAAARALTGKPLVAIGGISLERAPSVWAAGAVSVATIGALFSGARPPGEIARDFLRLFR